MGFEAGHWVCWFWGQADRVSDIVPAGWVKGGLSKETTSVCSSVCEKAAPPALALTLDISVPTCPWHFLNQCSELELRVSPSMSKSIHGPFKGNT